jgi:hypothetical protein
MTSGGRYGREIVCECGDGEQGGGVVYERENIPAYRITNGGCGRYKLIIVKSLNEKAPIVDVDHAFQEFW